MGLYCTMLNQWIGQQWSKAAKALKFDPTKPGQMPPRIEMFEEVTTKIRCWRTGEKKPNGQVGFGDVFTFRTTEPVDWVTLLRAFEQDPIEVRDGDRVYYKLKNPMFGPDGSFFCPDDRTLVFAGEKRLLKLLRGATPPPAPVFAQGKDWDRFLRGLLVVALDNRGGRLTKAIEDVESEDEDFDPAPMLEHADLWVFGLDNDDEIVFRGVGTCPDDDASESTARAIRCILDRARKEVDMPGPKTSPGGAGEEKAYRMAREFFKKMRVEREGRSVLVRSAGLGTLADFGSLVAAGIFN
jgi:hypothetical protein